MSDPLDLHLYSFEGCPYAQRTRLTLLEKGLPFKLTEIDLYNRPAWFASVSPYGKVPVLQHNGATVYESAIINQYVDESFPTPPLLPATALGRAAARVWIDYCDTRFLPASQQLLAAPEGPKRAELNAKLGEVMRFLDQQGFGAHGGEGPWFFGAQLTLVDLQFAPFFERFGSWEVLAGATWPADCLRLRRWFDHFRQRDRFAATAHSTGYHVEQRRAMQARWASAVRPAASA